MKRIILGLSVALLIISCSKSPEKIAESNISDYLKKNMDDPSSYESVEFGKLDTLHASFEESKEGIELRAKDNKLEERVTELSNKLDLPDLTMNDIKNIQLENAEITKKRLEINDILQSKTISYKGAVNGYSMIHKFRGKNKLGTKILNETKFLLDTKFNVQGEAE
ncbi:hypothetical protein AAIP55_002457 [Flavobacterium psychrophilum]|uniref:hypothetical protein n=1 Tax=Flavobacterium psychrophilum TaxID=96345 RepID=UPI000A3B0F6F|nr:hypothetical protein [Flavobacterium psychrophilum]EKT3964927.1 hypothetical protein [Flavobacterium psychrophilum]EKT4518405.1 hypothetical protein [Flavobacterium psychrophilum]OUD22447.1 hypothetical protein FPG92_13325 [Flavobacterium psychrophilum]